MSSIPSRSPEPETLVPSGFERGGVSTGGFGFERTLRESSRNAIDGQADQTASWLTGEPSLDRLLPSGSLSTSAVHEIEPLRSTDMPSLTGFAFSLMARLHSSKPIVWCVTHNQIGDYGHLYAHGCRRFGISPSQVVFVKVRRPVDLHFALEEALKTDGVAAVMGEGPLPNFTGSRRLSLLAKTHSKPCLLLNPVAGEGEGSAAQTRWQIEPHTGVTDSRDPFGPGLPTWRASLSRCRGGQTTTQAIRIAWDETAHTFRAASAFSNGAVHQGGSVIAPPIKAVVG